MRILLLVLSLIVNNAFALSLDDDIEDFEDAVEAAEQAGDNESFSKAYRLLNEAKSLGVDSAETQGLEDKIDKQKLSYDARIERQKQAKLEKQRQAERQARLERESSYNYENSTYSSSVSSGSNTYTYACYFKCRTDGFISYSRSKIGGFTIKAGGEYEAENNYKLNNRGKSACKKIRKSGKWMWLDKVECERKW